MFILYINDILEDLECDGLLFADDTCLIAKGEDPNITSAAINRDLEKILAWSRKWKVTFNAKKSKDMIFSKKCLNNSPPLLFDGTFFDRVNTHKHLGIYLTCNLDWSFHVNEICLKAYKKLAILRSVKFLQRNTLDLLYKLTVRSLIDYGLVVFGSNLKCSDLERLENIQYRAAKICTGALHLTSKEKLNLELGWSSIKSRVDLLGLCLFQKIHNFETKPLINTCMSQFNLQTNTRQFGTYGQYPDFGVAFSKSFFPYFAKKWNSLSSTTKNLSLIDFKSKLKSVLVPTKTKHFAYGSKLGNKLLTRLRVGRSYLNSNAFAVGRAATPICTCHYPNETTRHYLLHCFLYTNERQFLFEQVTHVVPNFPRMPQYQQENLLLSGFQNIDLHDKNVEINKLTQKFILQTKRFLIRH